MKLSLGYQFSGQLIAILIASWIHLPLECLLNYKLENDLKPPPPPDEQPNLKEIFFNLCKFCAYFLCIGSCMIPAYIVAYSKVNPSGSSPQDERVLCEYGNALSCTLSTLDYTTIPTFTALLTMSNMSLERSVALWIDYKEKNVYEIYLGSESSISQINDRLEFKLKDGFSFRNILIIKSRINRIFAVVMFFLLFFFFVTRAPDTSYMYQMALSSFCVTFSASRVLAEHNKAVERLPDENSEHKKNIKKILLIGMSFNNKAINAYAVIVISGFFVLIGFGYLVFSNFIQNLSFW